VIALWTHCPQVRNFFGKPCFNSSLPLLHCSDTFQHLDSSITFRYKPPLPLQPILATDHTTSKLESLIQPVTKISAADTPSFSCTCCLSVWCKTPQAVSVSNSDPRKYVVQYKQHFLSPVRTYFLSPTISTRCLWAVNYSRGQSSTSSSQIFF